MGQIRKINGVYYIEFHARGLLYSQVAGNSMEEARQLLLQVEEKIAGGEALTIARQIDLPDFYERFLSEARAQHTPKSVERYAGTVEHFSGFLSRDFPRVFQLSQLTPVCIESYKVYLEKTQRIKVANFSILLIRDILEFGIKLGFLNDNPSLHVSLLPWPKAPMRKQTDRYKKAQQLFSNGIGLGKMAILMKLPDISRAVYFANLIPLSREDAYK